MRGLLALALLGLLALPGDANAAYPGENGKIAYAVVGGLKTMNPDGTGQAQLTTGADLDPVWSPNGQQVAFVRSHAAVHVVNADGTGETPVTSSVPNEVATPTWSPEGQRIAYTVREGGQNDIWVVNVDGSGSTQLTDTAADESDLTWSPDGTRIAYTVDASGVTIKPDGSDRRFLPFPDAEVYQQDWSPDGSRMVFMTLYDCDGDTCADIVTRRLDGTGGSHVIGSDQDFTVTFDRPSWSPDGARIVLGTRGEIFTINPNGTGFAGTGVRGAAPDWQPLPVGSASSYVRPQWATPFRVPLVPAAKSCTAPNRTHGPPLAVGSCSPPEPGSSRLSVGGSTPPARSVGHLRIVVKPGDVLIDFSLTNVMRSADRSEYHGELRTEVTVRRTDGEPNLAGSTSMDFPIGFTVPCASSCGTTTSVSAIAPGAIKDGYGTIWELDKVRVNDGGADEDADTEQDNSLFMTQGVFVP